MQTIRLKNREINAVGDRQFKNKQANKQKQNKKEKIKSNARSKGKYCPMKVLPLM